jgi:PAS domain S-box-containing protein
MAFILQKIRTLPYALQIGLLSGLYFVLGRIGFLFAVVHNDVSLVWPSAGFALATLLLGGYKFWPGIAIGAFLVNLSNGVPVAAAVMIAAGNTLQCFAALYVLRRFTHFQRQFERIQDVVSYVVLAVIISTTISATVGAAALCLTQVKPWTAFSSLWWVWWAGDAMGLLIITPFILTWTDTRQPMRRDQRIEVVTLYAALVFISGMVFATSLATSGFYALAYLTFPFLVWAAFRFGTREVTTSSLLMWIVAAWGTTQHSGPFAQSSTQDSLVFAWSYIGTLSVTALLLTAAIGERKRSEGSLTESEARLQAIIQNLPFDIWVSDAEGRYVMQNPASVALWGNLIGKTNDEIDLPASVMEKWRSDQYRHIREQSQSGETDYMVNGEKRHFYYITSPIRDENSLRGILGANIDITERKQTEAALRRSEDRFAQAFRANPAALSISTLDTGAIIDVNPGFLKLTGFERREVIGQNAESLNIIVSPFSRTWFNKILLKYGKIRPGEAEIRTRDGEIRYVQHSSEIMEVGGEPHVLSIFNDITERKKAVTALRESEARFRAIYEGSSIGIIVVNKDGYPLSANAAFTGMIGYSEDELKQMPFRDFTHPEDVNQNLGLFEQLHNGEINYYQMDKRYIRKDGGVVWTRLTVSPMDDAAYGELISVALVEDISERREAEAALRESETRFRAIFEEASIGIVLFAPDGYPLSINPAVQRMLGYSETELLQSRFREFTYSDDIPQTVDRFQRLQAGEFNHYRMDKRYIRKDGEVVWTQLQVSAIGSPGPQPQGLMTVALIEDITQRKLAEERLRNSEAHNAALLGAMPDLMFLLDNEGVYLDYHAPEPAKLFATPETFIGKSVFDVMPHTMREPLQHAFKRALDTREIVIFEYPSPSDYSISFYEARILAFGDDKILIISRDITERKQAESAIQEMNSELERRVTDRTAQLAAANERLTELDRLKSKFIADVSHELRTPLAVLNTRVYLLENGLPEKKAEYLIGLREQIQRLIQFVNTVLDLSRLELGKGRITFEAVNLSEVVDQVTDALAPRAEANGLRLIVQCEGEMPPVRGEFNQLAQVATNLVANAINYTANGRIEVITRLVDNQVCLLVKDTGMGIAADDLPHLFERFYRGDRAGQTQIAGSGLGLSIVKEIVDLHGGTIEVESEVGRGSTFKVLLPQWEQEGVESNK